MLVLQNKMEKLDGWLVFGKMMSDWCNFGRRWRAKKGRGLQESVTSSGVPEFMAEEEAEVGPGSQSRVKVTAKALWVSAVFNL